MLHTAGDGYERLEVYQRAMALVEEVQSLIKALPSVERYALASQMGRASRSIPANIAEGYAKRKSAKEFRNYLTTRHGIRERDEGSSNNRSETRVWKG